MKKYFIFFFLLFYAVGLLQAANTDKLQLSGKIEDGARVIEMNASRYKFEPDTIVVELGEKVRLMLTSLDVAHGLAISEFKVNINVPPGKSNSIEFIADKKGEFPFYCSVYCGPGHPNMRGKLIVLEK